MNNEISSIRPVAVITGAAGGMGRAIARRLGARYRLVISDRDQAAVDRLATALVEEGYEVAAALATDVTDETSVRDLATAARAFSPVMALVHAVGVSPTMTTWQSMVDINLRGAANVVDAFLPVIAPSGAAVCIASSTAHPLTENADLDAILGDPRDPDLAMKLRPHLGEDDGLLFGFRAYAASKRGVIRLVERNVRTWAAHGSRIVSVSPGTILTPMMRTEATADEDQIAAMSSVVPMQRLGAPSDIAAAVDFLTSDLASYISGSDLKVDGGLIAGRLNPA